MTTNSEPTSPLKERTIRRRGAQTIPPAKRGKKDHKKLETPVLVAIISAVVTLITAIMGSPWFLSLVNKIDTPAPTSAVEFVSSQNSISNNPPGAELFSADFTPTERQAEIIESTTTPPGENPAPTAVLLESTLISTPLPPKDSDPPTPAAASNFQCIASDLWFPYPAALKPEISNDCWNLTEWGFSTDQGRLVLTHIPAQDQQRGIYMPISGEVDIHFNLQLNEFRTRLNKAGFLNFGIVQNEPFSIYTGGYLSYQQPLPGKASPVRILISGSKQATQNIMVQDAGFQHDVLFSIGDDLMRVYLNGEQAGDPVSLPPSDRAFWIGYVLPSNSELEVIISNFTIQAH